MRSMQAILIITDMAVLAAGCARGDMSTQDDPMAASAGRTLVTDSAMMRRHTQQMDSTTAAIRTHIAALRTRISQQRYAGMSDHVQIVGGLLSMMDRHMSEMGMHAGGPHAQHGDSGHGGSMHSGHSEVMAAAARLREEMGMLQTADRATVAARMGAHLERVEALLDLMSRNHQRHQH